MHIALAISEIQLELLSYLNNPSYGALARTCKIWREPALDALWHTQTGLSNLIRCFPNSILEEYSGTLHLKGIPTTEQMGRMLSYALRISKLNRSIDLGDEAHVESSHMEVHRSVWLKLEPLLPELLFPRLMHLQWPVSNIPDHQLHKLLSPKLFSALLMETNEDIVEALCAHRRALPNLDILFFTLGVNEKIGDRLADCLSHQTWPLTHLQLHRPNAAEIAAAADIPRLEYLSLRGIPNGTGKDFASGAFGNPRETSRLRSLELLACECIVDARHLLNMLPCASLRELTIETEEARALKSWQKLFEAIEKRCSARTLRILSIEENDPDGSEDEEGDIEMTISCSAMQPLLAFHKLESVSVIRCFEIHLDDAMLLRMAHAWPDIEILKLHVPYYDYFRWRYQPEGRATILGLNQATILCQKLRVFGALMDWRVTRSEAASVADSPQPCSELDELDVGSSPIPHDVTSLIFGLCCLAPCLDVIMTSKSNHSARGGGERPAPHAAAWQIILDAVRFIASEKAGARGNQFTTVAAYFRSAPDAQNVLNQHIADYQQISNGDITPLIAPDLAEMNIQHPIFIHPDQIHLL